MVALKLLNGTVTLLLFVFLKDKEIKHLPGFFRTTFESISAPECQVTEVSCKQPNSVSPLMRDKGIDQMSFSA